MIFLKKIYVFYVWGSFSACMYVHNICACGLQMVSYPLELELEMVVNHHVGAGNWTQVICKNKDLKH